jgi:hypothetical protein
VLLIVFGERKPHYSASKVAKATTLTGKAKACSVTGEVVVWQD